MAANLSSSRDLRITTVMNGSPFPNYSIYCFGSARSSRFHAVIRANFGSFFARGPNERPRQPTQRTELFNIGRRRSGQHPSAVKWLNTAHTDMVVHQGGRRCRTGRAASHILFAVVECGSTPRFHTGRRTIYSWSIYPKTRHGDGRFLTLFYSSMQYHGLFGLFEPDLGRDEDTSSEDS